MDTAQPPTEANKPGSAVQRPVAHNMIGPGHSRRGLTYNLAYYTMRVVGRLLFRMEVIHPERIPREGPVLILPTHTSYLDPPLVGSHVPRHMLYLARESLFKVPVLAFILRGTNTRPIRRGAGDREALRMCRAALQAGWPLVIFPEGTRSRTGKLGPLQGGFVMILEGLDVPYVPVNMQDTYRAMPRGRLLPWPSKVRMIVGEPRRVPAREPGEKTRDYVARCAAQLEADYRQIGVK